MEVPSPIKKRLIEGANQVHFDSTNTRFDFQFLASDFTDLFCVEVTQNLWNVVRQGWDPKLEISYDKIGKEFDRDFALKVLHLMWKENLVSSQVLNHPEKQVRFVRIIDKK